MPDPRTSKVTALPRTVISVVPDLKGGRGHMYGYHLAFGEAVRLNGWRHLLATSPDPELAQLPEGWWPCLSGRSLEAGFRDQRALHGRRGIAREILSLAASIARYVRSVLDQRPDEVVLFLERFNAMQLAALLIALLRLPRRRIRCWLLFRHEPHSPVAPGLAIHRTLLRLIGGLLGRGRLTLLADTEPLCTALSEFFGRPVTVVPIPHTHDPGQPEPRQAAEPVVFWWPGMPRQDKGWEQVRRFARLPLAGAAADGAWQLVLAASAGIDTTPGCIAAHAVADPLTPEEYQHWLLRADVVILPYDPRRYGAASSGIFTEAVVAGALPLVSAGTWMAGELERFDLAALILDWERPDLIAAVAAALAAPGVRERLCALRGHYLAYHCIPSLAATLHTLDARVPDRKPPGGRIDGG